MRAGPEHPQRRPRGGVAGADLTRLRDSDDAMAQAAETPFEGRERELDSLLERWRLSRDGAGQIALVSGTEIVEGEMAIPIAELAPRPGFQAQGAFAVHPDVEPS